MRGKSSSNSDQIQVQSTSDRRAAEIQLRAIIAETTHTRQRLISALRRHLRKRQPGAHEIVYRYRDSMVISFSPSLRGYEGILAIRIDADSIRLYFNRCRGLKDPAKLLRGSGKLSRWCAITSVSDLSKPMLSNLIDEAIVKAAAGFSKDSDGSVVFRKTSARK